MCLLENCFEQLGSSELPHYLGGIPGHVALDLLCAESISVI